MYNFNEKELDSLRRMRYSEAGRVVFKALERELQAHMTRIVDAGVYGDIAQQLTGSKKLYNFLNISSD